MEAKGRFFETNITALQVSQFKTVYSHLYYEFIFTSLLFDLFPPQKGELSTLGMFCVLSVLHGGNGFPFLAEPVYNYIVTGAYNCIQVATEDVPDNVLQLVIEKVKLTKQCYIQ